MSPLPGNGTNLSVGRITPVVDFTSADFDSLNADLTTYAQAKYTDGRWTDFNVNQFAVVFKELIAYEGDLLSYMLNSELRETFAATVIRRQNLVNIGKTYDYVPQGSIAAAVTLQLTMNPNGVYPTTILQTEQYSTKGTGSNQVNFHPNLDTVVASYPPLGILLIDATEGTYYENVLIGVSTGAPNQRWQLPQTGVQAASIEITVSASMWTATSNLTLNESTDNVYKVLQTDDGNTYVIFGDGSFGAIPPLNAQITATFNVGGGARGNVNPSTITVKTSVNAAVQSVTNPAKSSGGLDQASMFAARNGIPASLSTQARWVTVADYQNGISLIPGVAKVRAAAGYPSGSRSVQAWVAPNGGGAPTPVLLSAISTAAQRYKMVGTRLRLSSPVYKYLRLNVLLHVNPSFRANDVQQAVRAGITNPKGTGLLDFAQLDFGAVTVDANGDMELLVSQTALQAYFSSMQVSGLDRAEIQQCDVLPVAETPLSGNTGNGYVTNVVVTPARRRRQFFILLTSSSTFVMYERIVGKVTSLTDTVLSDANQIFGEETYPPQTPAYFAGWTLVLDANDPGAAVSVTSAAGSSIQTSTRGLSLFTMTEVGNSYYLFNAAAGVPGTVGGAAVSSADGSVTLRVVNGPDPVSTFLAGDSFTLDVYPVMSDVVLASDEYPVLLDTNFVTRTSGGSRV